MVMVVVGMSKPLFFSAARMRSRLSRTVVSGRPNGGEEVFIGFDRRNIDFNLDQVGVNAVDRGAQCFVEHAREFPGPPTSASFALGGVVARPPQKLKRYQIERCA